jgi:S-adenosyl-L-methionine hydrolase (adenosine-forming)
VTAAAHEQVAGEFGRSSASSGGSGGIMNPGIITLTTDFGLSGPYVAAVKGVLLERAPGAQLVDVCHTIAPQNILEGGFVLANIVDAFPAGTVHLAVVDPGVGTERRLIAVSVAGQWFVLPDNGLITGVTRTRRPDAIRAITNPVIRRDVVSATFHGRDILAPAAAHLAQGRPPEDLGPTVSGFVALRNFDPSSDEHGCVGEVIFKDTFGNLITNIHRDRLAGSPPDSYQVEIAGDRIGGIVRTYGERPTGTLVALLGSSGWLEIAIVNGDAGRFLTAGPGTTVRLRTRT